MHQSGLGRLLVGEESASLKAKIAAPGVDGSAGFPDEVGIRGPGGYALDELPARSPLEPLTGGSVLAAGGERTWASGADGLPGGDPGLDGSAEDRGDAQEREVVGPGGAVLDRGNRLGGDPGPVGDLGLAEAEFASTRGQESAGAVQFGEDVGQGLVSSGVELGLLIQPGVAVDEHGGGAGAGCGASSHHACAA